LWQKSKFCRLMSPINTKTVWPISLIAVGEMVQKSVFKMIPFSRKIDDSYVWVFYGRNPVSYPKEQNNFLVDRMYGWFCVNFWKKVTHLSHFYPRPSTNTIHLQFRGVFFFDKKLLFLKVLFLIFFACKNYSIVSNATYHCFMTEYITNEWIPQFGQGIWEIAI
jgi:hypothetical protein